MTIATSLDWFRQLMWTALICGGPVILAGLTVGIGIAILQAATQVNDSALSFVPKALATATALVVAGPWMLTTIVDFASAAIRAMGKISH